MELNREPIDQVASAGKKMLLVTKYLDPDDTQKIIAQIKADDPIIGFGENRTAALAVKNLNPDQVHFIGRLQSRQIPDIVSRVSAIHSLASLKHARLINKKTSTPIKIFIQVNVSADPAKQGIDPKEVPAFLDSLKEFENLEVIGFSNMGWGDFSEAEKRQEFRQLIRLRDQFLPGGLTSAGTSRDYELALEEGIDIIRIGSACFTA